MAWLRVVLAASIGSVLASTPAAAVEFSVGDGDKITLDITESLFLDWHFELEDPQIVAAEDRENVFDLRNRLNLRLRYDMWTLGLRFDAAWFPSPPSSQYQSDFRPEEIYLRARLGKTTLTLGDDFLSLGRGMALSLRKFDEVGFTTTLRGLHALIRTGRYRTRISAGLTNAANVDLVEEKFVPDPNDLIFAARFEGTPFKGFKFGVQGVDIERRHSSLREAVAGVVGGDDDVDPINNAKTDRSVIVGGNIELLSLADAIDIYAEFNYLQNFGRRLTAAGEVDNDSDGYALYMSATGQAGPLTVLAEGKRYQRFEVASSLHPDTAQQQGVTQTFQYVTPPTLERVDQRVINNTNVTGARLRLDYQLPDSKDQVFISGAYFIDAPAVDEFTLHTFGGWERIGAAGDRLLVQAGYRHEEAPDAGIIRVRMFHVDVDWFYAFSEHLDLQFHLNHEFRSKNIGAASLEDDYIEGTSYLTFNVGESWSFTGQFEYLTEESNDSPLFPGAFVQYNINDQSFVRLFGGRSKGGLKCSGGVCRVFPDFEGIKFESTIQF